MNALRDPLEAARALLDTAASCYADRPAELAEIAALRERLDGPLRVALVGSVKAGKSTLLNGLLGERIAPTDSRECTRIVTWYRFGLTPRVQADLADGTTATLPAKRQQGRLELDLQGLSPDDIERIDVTWPAPGVRDVTLIDTPGIASISHDVSQQTDDFLLPETGPAGADAVMYLLRSLHESDAQYIRALHERTQHGAAAMGAIAVLSRADEIGGGRLGAMVSVNQVVDELRRDPALARVCETIVPVAGLLGMGATTLRQADHAVLAALAAREPAETKPVLVTAERFIAAKANWLPEERVRLDLLDRFGLYGVRLAIAALRGGVADAGELAAELDRRSGLAELRRVIDVHFTQRQADLKAHTAVFALHRLARRAPVPGSDDLVIATATQMASAHTFTEMQLVGRITAGGLDLPADVIAELERLVGGRGAALETRLGVPAGRHASVEDLLAHAIEQLQRWRTRLENPLLDAATHDACRIAAGSCERIIAALAATD